MQDLNSSQLAAVEHTGSHLLIVAGPGTGKTHTLTRRIARMAKDLSKGRNALAITFTNKAAGEMASRLKAMSVPKDRVTGGTFHSFCLLLLKVYSSQTELPKDFKVAIPEELEELAKEIWPQRKPRQRRDALDRISGWKSSRWSSPPDDDVLAYGKKLRGLGILDFDDLLLETLYLFQTAPQVLKEVQNIYPLVFVDEYQDINAIQNALLKQLVQSTVHLTAIGDPNQAIYGFRGSDVRFFEQFPADFPGATVLPLNENYRSAKNLLSASSQLIAKNRSVRVPDPVARIFAEGRLVIHQCPTDKAEAEYVVHQIEKMVGGTSMFSRDSGRVGAEDGAQRSFGDVAVLYRLNSLSVALAEAFGRSGIPYHISGKAEGEDAVCPERADDISLDAERVSLMTLHAAKGLEFPVVFIVGCEDDILPLELEYMRAEAEEERRLLYVGMTRAKERLYLLSAKKRRLYGRTRDQSPSRFLDDIKEELKEYEKAPAKKRRPPKDDRQMQLF